MLVPFEDSLLYEYKFVACLAFSVISCYCYMKASGDQSETKSEVNCANGSNDGLLLLLRFSDAMSLPGPICVLGSCSC